MATSKPLRPAVAIVFGFCLGATGLAAQETELRGTVVDEEGSPVHQALVTVQELGLRTSTAQNGTFEIVGIATGTHEILIVKAGYPNKIVQLVVRANSPSVTDLGTITLSAAVTQGGVLSFVGTVIDEKSGNPVPAATVSIGETASTSTDATGSFSVSLIVNDPARAISVRAGRIGYLPLQGSVEVAEAEQKITLRLALEPSPIELSEIVVEGESRLVPSYMIGFYERMRLNNGTFFTAEEIEKLNPPRTSELLRRVAGLDVIESGALALSEQPTYRFSSGGVLGCPEANLFVDGVRVLPQSFGLMIQPDRLAGIEVYRGAVTPAQFDVINRGDGSSGCGAIVAWTKPVELEKGPAPIILGAYFGNSLGSSQRSGQRFGGHIVLKFVGPVELVPGFGTISEVGGRSGSAWQLLVNFRGRPLGALSPWYLGGGFTVISRPFEGGTRAAVGAKAYPMGLTGIQATLGSLQPFSELHVVNLTQPSAADINLLFGIGVRIGGS